jgi:hypothetical protein
MRAAQTPQTTYGAWYDKATRPDRQIQKNRLLTFE